LKNEKYREQLNLLLEILPYALKDERMALKGGTSINLFHRNFPRLSVDIDLCYLPLEDRKTSLNNIHQILSQIKSEVEKELCLQVTPNHPLDGKKEAKILVKKGKIGIKVEPNYTVRGILFSSEVLKLSQNAQKEFGKYLEVRCVGIADAYGGKICAALDRQHPRDLFDIKYLLDNEGITEKIKDSFLFYLISHNRPINELLNPNFKDISKLYHNEFAE
jgi:predicted nucleotidyltransferase component of viral defense system